MKWVETTEEKERWDLLQQPFEILREMPNNISSRVKTLKGAEDEARQRQIDLRAQGFPCLVDQEPKISCERRMNAFDTAWRYLSTRIKEVLEVSSSKTFEEIARFAHERHPNKFSESYVSRGRIVPTGLTIAGSVNAADNSETFPNLSAYLESQDCYTALLSSREIGVTGNIAPSVCSILQQFSGLQTDADDIQALTQWYQDETTASKSPEEGIVSPLGKMALQTPCKVEPGESQKSNSGNVSQKDSQDPSSPFEKLELNTPQLKKLRPRIQPNSQACKVKQEEQEETARQKLQNLKKPLVVIIQGTESVSFTALQDLILTISENRAELPITLILGLATSSNALNQILPSSISDMLDTRNFHLVQALAKLEAVFQQIFFSPEMPFILSHSLMKNLDDKFMLHDFTVRSIEHSLKFAFLTHFQQTPLSHLSALQLPKQIVNQVQNAEIQCQNESPNIESSEANKSVSSELEGISKQVLRQLCENSELPHRPLSIENTMENFQIGFSDWKLALLIVGASAKYTGTSGLSLRELYRDASGPNFTNSPRGGDLFYSLEKGLEDLSNTECTKLVDTLIELAKGRKTSSELQQLVKSLEVLKDQIKEEIDSANKFDIHNDQENLDPNPSFYSGKISKIEESPFPWNKNNKNNDVEEQQGKAGFGTNASKRRNVLAQAVKDKTAKENQSTKDKIPGKELCNILQQLRKFIDRPPIKCTGSKIFVIDQPSTARSTTEFSLREVIDKALSSPEKYWGSEAFGLGSEQLDIVLAYYLLTDYGEDIDVGDWFSGFCMLHQKQAQNVGKETEESPPKKAKISRARGSRKIIQEKPAVQVKPAKRTQKNKINVSIQGEENGLADSEKLKFDLPLEQLISRFTQATNELQLLGIVKAAPRKKNGNSAQRLVFGSGYPQS